MFSKLTAAVAGTGFIGPVHVEALRRLGIRVKGILGSSPEKSLRAAEKLGLEVGYRDFDDIMKDEDIQVVHITTPNMSHFSMAQRALLAGKHVMCEKPLGMNSRETSELVNLARQSGLGAGVTYNVRFYPMNLEARVQIKAGSMGKIFSVTGSYVQDWLLHQRDFNWRVLSDQGGALRAVADIGTHWMDLVQFITGLEVSAVFAHLSTVHLQRSKPFEQPETYGGAQSGNLGTEFVNIDTEDCGCILFKYKQGGQGVLWVSQVSAGFKNRIRYEIAGAEKSISWDSDRANQLMIGYRDKANEILEKDPALNDTLTSRYIDYPGGHLEGFPDTFKQCFRSFYNSVLHEDQNREILYATFEEGHREMQLCEAILTSHHENRWIYLTDLPGFADGSL